MSSYRRRLRRITAAPCLFWKRLCGRKLGQSLPKLSDDVFPETLWKAFGEHMGEEEEEEEDQEKGEGEA